MILVSTISTISLLASIAQCTEMKSCSGEEWQLVGKVYQRVGAFANVASNDAGSDAILVVDVLFK